MSHLATEPEASNVAMTISFAVGAESKRTLLGAPIAMANTWKLNSVVRIGLLKEIR